MFRGARRADLDAILKIYARARQAMADSGNPTQWGDHFPPQELLEEDIDSNRLFLYLVNGELEGVFAFILGPDPTYARIEDGKWLNDTLPYGTIHRLASAGRHPGVAAAVITWCLEHCESLRADTHADNKIMQHLLEENGFFRFSAALSVRATDAFFLATATSHSSWQRSSSSARCSNSHFSTTSSRAE